MRPLVHRFLCLGFILGITSTAIAVPEQELLAKQAADSWLAYIDDGKYHEALSLAAPDLREGITKKAWADGLHDVRSPLGAVKQRRLQRLFATSVLPGNIEGDFVVVNFRTTFALREEPANEILILTPVQVNDSGKETWQVMSFYIE